MEDALAKLLKGNENFACNSCQVKVSPEKRQELCKGQCPSAIVLACSDSRVAPEIIFDASLGEIFVVRTAGNVLDKIALGSIEYAALHLHTSLIIVLGHEKCGAVTAACKVENGAQAESPNISAICKKILPAVKAAKKKLPSAGEAEIIEKASAINVKKVISKIRKSHIISKLLSEGKIKIVGAKHSITCSKVEML
ncbi:carbonic anhydrase [Candidatus Micrarchaeota archaeon CG11_big_fil_rev_8_21_14_0_20_47_5]|nr:MAG: hypothetical protein AUJ17_01275 [Candidatus Micrarchaeota archaeon CG1_02_47_40]PIN84163.1 MAG: carbonic anhydrase [Candidatus Micrarchaeota archaeon CG11_big_fil_rev_8_21_14_0_20_47_5]